MISTEIMVTYGMIDIKNKLLIYIEHLKIRNSKLTSMLQVNFNKVDYILESDLFLDFFIGALKPLTLTL